MMSDTRVMWYTHKELDDPIAVIGFPSVGLVGSIVTSFLARELELPISAALVSPDFPPYTLVQRAQPFPPIRIYAGPVPKPKRKKKAKTQTDENTAPEDSVNVVAEAPAEAKVTKKKRVKPRDIIIVTSEISPKPEDTYDVAMTVFDTLKEMGATDFVCIDGVPRMDPNAEVIGVASSKDAAKELEAAGLQLMSEGLVRGVSGIVLYEGLYENRNVMSIVSPANQQIPDPRAAASVLEILCKIVPNLSVDTLPLRKEAEEIDQRVKAQQQSQQNVESQNIYG